MEKITLTTESREVKKRGASVLRSLGKIPAVIYGHGTKPTAITVDYKQFEKVYNQAGGSSIVTLKVGNEDRNVIISEVALDPVSDQILHIDFHQIRMDEKITAEIEIKIVGLAPAVKEQGGILISNLDKVEIECLPGDLIRDYAVDVSGLKNLRDSIHVSDLVFPEGIEVKTPLEEVIVLVEEPRSEAELDALNEEIKEDVESVEGIKKEEPKEGEEGAEGEASTEGDATAAKSEAEGEAQKSEEKK
jgi:large subunit ribosomal protein L25